MDQTNYTVLFIDDHSSNYLPSLEPVASEAGFDVYATDNVLDGLEFINTYPETVNAVLLDINFPNGEMQGIEALQKIKQLQPFLPVIMLTDRDSSEDIDLVVECMKKGAYNYVGKRSLNPVYLFKVLETAVQQAQVQIRLNAKNITREKKQRFYTLTEVCSKGRFSQVAVFGFELVSVNKPSDVYEAELLEKSAFHWHENLLKTISNIYRDELQMNLKYIPDGKNIKCCLLFTVYAMDEAGIEQILNNLQHDISAFFSASGVDITHPYVFQEIFVDDFLRSATLFTEDFKYNVFYRKPIKVREIVRIGFTQVEKTAVELKPNHRHDELFAIPTKTTLGNELLTALLNQEEYAEIDIQLNPKQFQKNEIDAIRKVSKNPLSIETTRHSHDELNAYADYLQSLIGSSTEKFLISIVLKRRSLNLDQHLKTGIINYFFGSQADIMYPLRTSPDLNRFSTDESSNENPLPFMYSIYDALQAFRLPIPALNALPGIPQQSQSFHDLPDNLSGEGILMGVKRAGQNLHEVKIAKDALARHLYIMGQTGTGKSTMLKTMIADCLKKNEGFAVIDPHGDLYDDVLKMIPKSKQKRLTIINTTNPDESAKHNPIGYDVTHPESKSLVINELFRIFSSLYDMRTAGGPMFELYFKNGLLLILDENVQAVFGTGTLLDFVEMFFNDTYRKELLELCGNKKVVDFFKVAHANSGDQAFTNFATYVTSKLNRFTEDFYLTPIISSKTDNVDFRKLIDEGNILLVKMDKGLIGAENASLLGQMIISSIVLAAMSRGNIEKESRKPFHLFIDEFQNFIKGDIGSALSEVRKYGLSLTLANQTLGQLDNHMIESLMGNVGSLVFFRPGINDYEKIRHFIEPEFTRSDVLKLPNFNCIARLMIDNVPCDPFVFQTIKE